MNPDAQEDIYSEIMDKYINRHLNERAEKISILINELTREDLRGLLIIGAAYIEELCNECFLQTLYKGKRRRKFEKDLRREMTFSMTSNLLWAQNYITDEIFELISIIRDVRNKLAHNAFIEQNHSDLIEAKAHRINELMQGQSFSFHPEMFGTNYDLFNIRMVELESENSSSIINQINKNTKSYLVAITDMIVGLSVMSLWLIPEEKLAIFEINKDDNLLFVNVGRERFTENTFKHIENKYNV